MGTTLGIQIVEIVREIPIPQKHHHTTDGLDDSSGTTMRGRVIEGGACETSAIVCSHSRTPACLTLATGCDTLPAETPGLINRDTSLPLRSLVGTEYTGPRSTKIIARYGDPETILETNDSIWIGYFPKGNITLTHMKPARTIIRLQRGRQPR